MREMNLAQENTVARSLNPSVSAVSATSAIYSASYSRRLIACILSLFVTPAFNKPVMPPLPAAGHPPMILLHLLTEALK